MDMTGERRIAAPRQKVWEALNDPAVLKASIPGCESLEKEGDTDLKATASVKIGPISARFTGKVKLTDLDPPNSYRISGEGQGGVAGFAKGGADVRLADDGDGTLLSYDVKAQVGGKIAQLGARLIDATSKQMADMFFDRFSAIVAPPKPMIEPVDFSMDLVPPGAPLPAPRTPPVVGEPAPSPSGFVVPPPEAMPSISIFSLMPTEMLGLPTGVLLGLVIWLFIFVLIFKGYVFG